MIEIINHEVAFLNKAIIASGLPMRTFEDFSRDIFDKDIDRAKKLGKVKQGTGHDTYLIGVAVNVTLKAPTKFWLQFERYSFQDTVSSTSKMHMLTKVNLDDVLPPTIYEETKKRLEEDIKYYNDFINAGHRLQDNLAYKLILDRTFQRITDNVPQGYLSTRTITTNYLQLKTMYKQRKNHKLMEWRVFSEWIESLPMFLELIGG